VGARDRRADRDGIAVSRLEEVLGDLEAESRQLEDLLVPLPDEGWRVPTPAVGWDVAHQVAHLTWSDECAVHATLDGPAWAATVQQWRADPAGSVDAAAAAGAAARPHELLDRWRSGQERLRAALRSPPEGARIPWFGPPMSATSMATARFMETWAHGRDVAAALGVELPADDRVRHVVHLGVRTRGFAYANRGLPEPESEVGVRLTLPSGEGLSYGAARAASTITGSAYDFARVVTRRLHPADAALTAHGHEAGEWLAIAQAFAGPPGTDRPRR
jgi:uncharacterized protein (TIGR03084 family)